MKKHFIPVLLAALILSGCGNGDVPATVPPTDAPAATAAPTEAPTLPPETAPPVTETIPPAPVQTEPPVVATEPPAVETVPPATAKIEGLYLVKVTDPDYPIHEEPGYDTPQVGTVKEAGTYTILEEVWDNDAYRWGRLRSGAGWIRVDNLTKQWLVPLSVDYADQKLLTHWEYHSLVVDDSEYAFPFVFYPHEKLTNVLLTTLVFGDDGYEIGESRGSFEELTPDMPLVVWASFPGDMSAYGIIFTDSQGQEHTRMVSISGRDGSMLLTDLE